MCNIRLPINNSDSPEREEELFRALLKAVLAKDDGAAAAEHLAAGRPITYRDARFPNAIMRKWPDGRRELVDVDEEGNIIVLRPV
jgi:hypothetical protein